MLEDGDLLPEMGRSTSDALAHHSERIAEDALEFHTEFGERS